MPHAPIFVDNQTDLAKGNQGPFHAGRTEKSVDAASSLSVEIIGR